MLTAVACVAATVLAGCTGSAERAGAPASPTVSSPTAASGPTAMAPSGAATGTSAPASGAIGSPTGSAEPSPSGGPRMPLEQFWAIIAATKPSSSRAASDQVARLRTLLAARSTEEILAFDRRFRDLHRTLATPRHRAVAWIIVGFYLNDEFFNIRTMSIMRGQKAYERFLADPDSFVDLGLRTDEQLKSWWAVAELVPELYAARTGQDLPDDHPSIVIPVLGPDVDDATYARLAPAYPRLTKAYLPPAVLASGTPRGGGARSVTWFGP